jgi:hypothetical protein
MTFSCTDTDEDEVASKPTNDDNSLSASMTHERQGHRVLAVPAVRRIAMEKKVR